MEYSKVYEEIYAEKRYWIRFIPYERNPIFFIAADDANKVFVYFENGQWARASMQMALDFGYDPEALR